MKKRYLIFGSFVLFSHFTKAQQATQPKEVVPKTSIDLVYNQYLQDGEHSAITGGEGTEELTVYGPMVNIKKQYKKDALNIKAGADIISSASTDKIDFVVSSASSIDQRVYTSVGYEYNAPKKLLQVYGGAGVSIESDYVSLGTHLGATKQDKTKSKTYSAKVQMYQDDLRWGRRVLPKDWLPLTLVYPAELRYKDDWYDTHIRQTYTLQLGYKQIINKRMIAGLFPEVTYQTGLLSTPFHRVYFTDGSLRPEQLPDQRLKLSLTAKVNSFVGGRFILKNNISGYQDNYGINSVTLKNETAYKLRPNLTLLLNGRYYAQSKADFFAPKGEHLSNNEHYTSDYDYNNNNTIDIGGGIKLKPFKSITKRYTFNSITLRYNHIKRSDGLYGHVIALAIGTEYSKHK